MNILHVIGDLDTGGAEAMLYKLLKSSPQESHCTTVISLKDHGVYGQSIEKLGIVVHAVNLRSRGSLLSRFKYFYQLIRELRPDVVQTWMYHSNIIVSLLAIISFSKYRVVWNIRHALDDLPSEKKLTRWVIKLGAILSFQPDRIIFNSYKSLQQHQSIGYRSHKLQVIVNGFDLNIYKRDLLAKQSLYQSLNLPENGRLVGMVARFHLAKGHQYFVEAAGEIMRQNSACHFLLVGKNVDADNVELNQWIQATNYPEKFHLLGEQTDCQWLFPAMTLLVNPSTTEAFPNVLGEAMLSEVPCIATDVGDSKRIIGECGRVVPAKDSNALSHAILEMLLQDEVSRQKIGSKARLRIVGNYSIEAVAKQYENLYLDCCKQK